MVAGYRYSVTEVVTGSCQEVSAKIPTQASASAMVDI